jgi:hypothetical protein
LEFEREKEGEGLGRRNWIGELGMGGERNGKITGKKGRGNRRGESRGIFERVTGELVKVARRLNWDVRGAGTDWVGREDCAGTNGQTGKKRESGFGCAECRKLMWTRE